MTTEQNTPLPQEETQEQPAVETTPTVKKTTSGCGWIVAIFVLIAIAVGGVVYYFHVQDKEAEAYAILQNNENIKDYEAYLQDYPNGQHASEVKQRLEALNTMYGEWARLQNSPYASDFERFKQAYPQSMLVKECEVKIDSLDWVLAQKINTSTSFAQYMEKHPEGRYISEAITAQSMAQDTELNDVERTEVARVLDNFYTAFGRNDEEDICVHIAPVMTQFLSKRNATKADVVELIGRTYSDHIQSCRFVLGNDYAITKKAKAGEPSSYEVSFSVDQHITRDNDGKTFGSYTAKATLNSAFQLTSLQMTEVSRANGEGKTTLQSVAKDVLKAIGQ